MGFVAAELTADINYCRLGDEDLPFAEEIVESKTVVTITIETQGT
jgi:hypothetical protein